MRVLTDSLGNIPPHGGLLSAGAERIMDLLQLTVGASSIHFSHHDIDAAEDHHDVGDGVAEAHVFQHVRLMKLGGRTR